MAPEAGRAGGRNRPRGSFTLIEMLVALAILSILLVVLLYLTQQVSRTWSYTMSRTEQFRKAQSAFEVISRRLSQATLNTYTDYVSIDASGNMTSRTPSNMTNFLANAYARQSELRFMSGPGTTLLNGTTSTKSLVTHAVFFQAPLGFVADASAADTSSYGSLANLLNTWGYYIEFGPDPSTPSFVAAFIPAHYRYRLMEMMEPSESLSIYKYTSAPNPGASANLRSSAANGKNWFTDPLGTTPSEAHVLADNVIALIIIPRLSTDDQAYQTSLGVTGGDGMLATNYYYDSSLVGRGAAAMALDSDNQLPPDLQVTLIATDEPSFSRFQGAATTAKLNLSSLFQTVGDTVDPTKPGFAKDLQTLETLLATSKLNYRVFTTTVPIKGAKWSLNQSN